MAHIRRVAVMIDLAEVVVHHHQIFAGIQRYASERGNWECSLNPHADQLLSDWKPGRGPDGIVGRATAAMPQLSLKTGVPVVNVWMNSPARSLPAVLHDAHEAGRMAARHLLSRGFQHLGCFGNVDKSSILEFEGFREEVAEAGRSITNYIAPLGHADEGVAWREMQEGLRRWMDAIPRPIGIYASDDIMARYLIEAARARQIKVPHDMAVIGSANEPVICTRAIPSLSSIDFGFDRVGYEAAALLDRLMDGAPAPAEPIWIVPASLEARQSSDAYVVEHPLVAASLRFLAEHSHEPIDVDQVADRMLCSRRTLARLFQSELGQTVYDVLTRMRLERAKRRMMEPGALLKKVAADCGFRNAAHLGETFRRVEGVSPNEYRTQRGWKG